MMHSIIMFLFFAGKPTAQVTSSWVRVPSWIRRPEDQDMEYTAWVWGGQFPGKNYWGLQEKIKNSRKETETEVQNI